MTQTIVFFVSDGYVLVQVQVLWFVMIAVCVVFVAVWKFQYYHACQQDMFVSRPHGKDKQGRLWLCPIHRPIWVHYPAAPTKITHANKTFVSRPHGKGNQGCAYGSAQFIDLCGSTTRLRRQKSRPGRYQSVGPAESVGIRPTTAAGPRGSGSKTH